MENKKNKIYPVSPMKASELLKIKGGYKAISGPLEPMHRFNWEDIEIRFQGGSCGSTKNSFAHSKVILSKVK